MTKFTKEQQELLENLITFREGSNVFDIWGSVGGSVEGNVGGNVNGNVKGDVLGDVEGHVYGNVAGHVAGDINGHSVRRIEELEATCNHSEAMSLDYATQVKGLEDKLAKAMEAMMSLVNAYDEGDYGRYLHWEVENHRQIIAELKGETNE